MSLPASSSALVTVLGRVLDVIAVPSNASVPLPSSSNVVIFTLTSVAPASLSKKAKLLPLNVKAVSSVAVTLLVDDVGRWSAVLGVLALAVLEAALAPMVLMAETR